MQSKKSGKISCRWIFLDIEINKAYKLDLLYRFPTVLNEEQSKEMNGLFDCIFATDDFWENQSYCYKIIGLLLKYSESAQNKTNQGIQKSLEYMTKNYNKTITISELAKIANTSESNFITPSKKASDRLPLRISITTVCLWLPIF